MTSTITARTIRRQYDWQEAMLRRGASVCDECEGGGTYATWPSLLDRPCRPCEGRGVRLYDDMQLQFKRTTSHRLHIAA